MPHGLLHQVPFECLHDGHHYVDDIWQVVRCPTTDFLVQHRRRSRRTRARRSLVIAGTRPGSPFIEEEARRVCSVLDPGGCDLMIDSPAGDALQAMRSARIIHLSAHGNFRPDNPLFSTLHLGPDVLFLADILETPITADLAVLSACNSGHIFSGRGDALLGVAHAFLAAGARELVATLWRVHDQATAGWMEAFHRAHAGGSDPATARRTASLATRRTWPHPFHWGGFCVLGA